MLRQPTLAGIVYPESDGRPVGETDVHRREILETIAALDEHFRTKPLVYISGNILFYYEEGNPAAVISPDIFVVKGITKRLRRNYKLWEERLAPNVVIEVSSRSTRLEDAGHKRALYLMMGVGEYFIFDPLAEYLKPPLKGFRLARGEYQPITPSKDGAFVCAQLGLRIANEDSRLALFDLATGARLMRPAELAAAYREAAQEIERLRAELEQLRHTRD